MIAHPHLTHHKYILRQQAIESGQQPEPLRQSDLIAISDVFGEEKLEDEALVVVCDKYGLEQ